MKKLFLAVLLTAFLFIADTSYASDKVSNVDYTDVVKEHNLPYPGLLPDSRFYFIKMTRDKVIGMLISDPIKKVEYDILTADKRLSSGIYLLMKTEDKYQLATSTISKGENYFVDAVSKLELARKQGIGISETKERVSTSLKKHQDILKRLETKFKGNTKGEIAKEIKRVEQLQKTVSSENL